MTMTKPEVFLPIPERLTIEHVAGIATVPGLAFTVRDGRFRLVRCNQAFAAASGVKMETLPGTTLADILPPDAAAERMEIQKRVMSTGKSERFFQLASDRRLICMIAPLDESSWGHPGTFGCFQEIPATGSLVAVDELPTLRTPCLDRLDRLTPRELEVLYFIAQGITSAAAADELGCSAKTVENHVESIHRKLRTSGRAGLVRYTSERGIQSFGRDEWFAMVETKRAGPSAAAQPS